EAQEKTGFVSVEKAKRKPVVAARPTKKQKPQTKSTKKVVAVQSQKGKMIPGPVQKLVEPTKVVQHKESPTLKTPVEVIKTKQQEVTSSMPLLQQLSQKPILQPTKQKETVSIASDRSFDQGRDKLKEVFSPQQPAPAEQSFGDQASKENNLKQFISASAKRQQLKEFFMQEKPVVQENVEEKSVEVSSNKQKSLKNFFSNVPMTTEQEKTSAQEGSVA
ncbi:MAG: hypothetical protein V1855_00560, partial [bacterium]